MPCPIVIHIPHARVEIPGTCRAQFSVPDWVLAYETLVLTDWLVDELFDFPGITQVIAPINRIVVDVERYDRDDIERMAQFGMGCIYTHGTRGEQLRRIVDKQLRESLLAQYYHPHHQRLGQSVKRCIQNFGHCLLVDAHSFPNEPFMHELAFEDAANMILRPDICFGTSDGNSPQGFIDNLVEAFSSRGYSVAINSPYSGCVVPEKFEGDSRVRAVMIEINRSLYLDQVTPRYDPEVQNTKYWPVKSPRFCEVKESIQAAIFEVVNRH